MLQAKSSKKPIKAVLRTAMVIDSEDKEKGDVVELAHREFSYLAHHNRVLEATQENIAAVKAEAKSEAEAAKRAAQPSELDVLRARVAELEAKLTSKAK